MSVSRTFGKSKSKGKGKGKDLGGEYRVKSRSQERREEAYCPCIGFGRVPCESTISRDGS